MQMGNVIKEEELEKAKEMKDFLKHEFGTDKIQNIDEDDLKKRIQGDSVIDRLKYRKQVGLINMGRKQYLHHHIERCSAMFLALVNGII